MIDFRKEEVVARFRDPRRAFAVVELPIEIRTCPLSGAVSRFTPTRVKSASLHEDEWPDVAAAVEASRADCPFCPETLLDRACALDEGRFGVAHVTRGAAFLFPNIAPYGPCSAVTVIGPEHYTEIGAYDPARYLDAFLCSRDYIRQCRATDPSLRFAAITQNHLPASGGTIVHPHLQVQVDTLAPTFAASLRDWQLAFRRAHGEAFWPRLVAMERSGERYVGKTGRWDWLTMWAPQGLMEVWGVADAPTDFESFDDGLAAEMIDGLLRLQRWHRSRNRNSFNLAVYFSEPADEAVTLVCRIFPRNNWASFARSDRSFYEVVLGELVFDQTPEAWAAQARGYF
jgi:galactose-1-phosphate uridylyltransferase